VRGGGKATRQEKLKGSAANLKARSLLFDDSW
jgi:hypothetical protein